MICGAQVELNVSQRGWDQLFETISLDANGYEVTSKDPTKTYTRKMTYIDIPFLAHLAFGRDRGLQFFVHAGPQISFLISESETIKGIAYLIHRKPCTELRFKINLTMVLPVAVV